MDAICLTVVDSLVRIWVALHKDVEVVIAPKEASYLRRMILEVEDDLIARLLAAKLSCLRAPDGVSGDVVRLGSDVRYAVQGREHRARIVHGLGSGGGLLGVGSRFGSALVGFRAGQAPLWPLEQGRLVEVKILHVEPARKMLADASPAGIDPDLLRP